MLKGFVFNNGNEGFIVNIQSVFFKIKYCPFQVKGFCKNYIRDKFYVTFKKYMYQIVRKQLQTDTLLMTINKTLLILTSRCFTLLGRAYARHLDRNSSNLTVRFLFFIYYYINNTHMAVRVMVQIINPRKIISTEVDIIFQGLIIRTVILTAMCYLFYYTEQNCNM